MLSGPAVSVDPPPGPGEPEGVSGPSAPEYCSRLREFGRSQGCKGLDVHGGVCPPETRNVACVLQNHRPW
jgi:hypothetical protein